MIPRPAARIRCFGGALMGAVLSLSLTLPTPLEGQQLHALVVVSNGQNPIPADAALAARLEETFGFQVTLVGAPESTTADIIGKDLIVTVASAQSSDYRAKFFDASVPLFNTEQAVLDNDYQMSMGGRGTSTSQTQIDIVDSDHPMAAGLSGRVTVYSQAESITRGTPRADTASIIARSLDQPDQSCIFGYETGAEMYNGLIAPARRVHFMLSDNSFLALNDDGLRLFDAAIRWVTDLSTEDSPPRIIDVSPADGASFQPVDVPLGFTVTTHPANTIPTTPDAIQMVLNGVDVSASLTVGGSEFNRTVSYTGALDANELYTVEVLVMDDSNRESFRIWHFDTLIEAQTVVIEAEDYNFTDSAVCAVTGEVEGELINGGQFIDDPPPSDFNEGVYTNLEVGYVDRVGVPGVDFSDTTEAGGSGLDNAYRFCDPVGTQPASDTRRQKYIDHNVREFHVHMLQPGEWLNYTRTFEDGNYRVFLRASATVGQTVRLYRVVGNPSQPNQTTSLLGEFTVPAGGGYDFLPLTEPGATATAAISLSGVQTLRLLALTANDNLNLNYMLVAPTTEEPGVSGPFVENLSPERDSTNARRDGIAATITNRETELNAGSIELLVDGVQVTTGLTVSPTATGADISYVVSPPFGQASTHTVQLRYNDTQGNLFFNSWSFTTSPDALPIFTAPRLENGGLKLLVAFAEPPDPATAGEVNNYSSSGGVAFDAVELLGPRAVELSGTPVADGQAHLLTVRNLQDTLGNDVPEATISYNISPFLQDSAQRVAFEAESFHTNSAGTGETYDGHMWGFSVDIPGYSGGGYMHNPLAFPLVEVSDVDSAARMDYRVRFTHPGAYRLWIRATESPGTKDSCHYGIDGVHVAAVGGIAVGVFNWSAQPEDAATLGTNRFDIPAAGDYTVNIWVREDNLPLDKILIVPESDSINPSFENGGLGPDQSPRVGDIAVPDQPVLQYSRSSASELTFDWTGAGFHLEQTTDLVNPAWTDVPNGDTPPIAVPMSGEGMFFRLSD